MIDLSQYTFDNILREALARVPETIDRRVGSVIYDALAPACYQLAEFYLMLDNIQKATYATSSYGNYLDMRVAEAGLTRIEASKAIKRGCFTDEKGAAVIPLGSRFSCVDTALTYITVEAESTPGCYLLECESAGIDGNMPTGALLPITHINLVTAQLSDLIVPARDTETDQELLERYIIAVNDKPFGGNLQQYRETLLNMDGVGAVQVYPVWAGGGTVKCCIIGSDFRAVTNGFIDMVKEDIDPNTQSGEGLGLVPIGHKVTIASATERKINITLHVEVLMGYLLTQVQPYIKDRVEAYFEQLRRNWGKGDDRNRYQTTIYVAQILASVLAVPGIANVTDVTINGVKTDMKLHEDATLQELPVLGDITYV